MDYSHITQEGLLQWKRGREREKKEDKSWIPWHRDVVVRFAWWWGGRGKLDLGWSRHGYPASLTLHVNENRAEHNSLAPVAARPSARRPLEHQPGRQLPISPRSRSLLLSTTARCCSPPPLALISLQKEKVEETKARGEMKFRGERE